MNAPARLGRLAVALTWLHAVLFGVIAVACYVAPEVWFGDAAWLPLARLAMVLFAAALVALTIVFAGVAASGSARQVSLALLAAAVFDAQVPFWMFSLPASLEYLDRNLGIPWWVIPLSFQMAVGATLYIVLGMRRTIEAPTT